jgi:hypothetical protein
MYKSQQRYLLLFWQADVQEPKLSHAAVPTLAVLSFVDRRTIRTIYMCTAHTHSIYYRRIHQQHKTRFRDLLSGLCWLTHLFITLIHTLLEELPFLARRARHDSWGIDLFTSSCLHKSN